MTAIRNLVSILPFVTACVTGPTSDEVLGDDKADRGGRPPSGTFTYNPSTQQCANGRGVEGLNRYATPELAKPCTDFRNAVMAYVRLDAKDLRGSVFGNNQTYGGSLWLDNADLRDTKFETLMEGHGFYANDADVRGADLSAVEIMYRYEGREEIDQIVQLGGAMFDATTKLPLAHGVRITADEASDKYGMLFVETEDEEPKADTVGR